MDKTNYQLITHAADSWEAMLTSVSTMFRAMTNEDVWETVSMREYDVLYTLSKAEKPMRLTDLNEHVLLSQPALSRMADRLIAKGYISRCKDAHDGRAMALSLTEAGLRAQKATGARHVKAIYARMSAAFTETEMDQIAALSHKLTAVIDAECKRVKGTSDE